MKKWKTLVALVPLILAIVMKWWWFFTLLFLLQIAFALLEGKVDYVEEVKKSEHPIIYWLVIGVWVFLGGISLSYYFV